MKVRVSHLPPEGLPIKGELPLESLNARMNEGRENDIVFTISPQVDLLVTRTPQGAETRGTVKAQYAQPCGRCELTVPREVEIEANWVLQRRPDHTSEMKDEDFEDDVGISFFDGDQVDLEPLLQELLILQLDLYWHPPCDAGGCCLHCKKKVEEPEGKEDAALQKISLGALLKKAGVSNN